MWQHIIYISGSFVQVPWGRRKTSFKHIRPSGTIICELFTYSEIIINKILKRMGTDTCINGRYFFRIKRPPRPRVLRRICTRENANSTSDHFFRSKLSLTTSGNKKKVDGKLGLIIFDSKNIMTSTRFDLLILFNNIIYYHKSSFMNKVINCFI